MLFPETKLVDLSNIQTGKDYQIKKVAEIKDQSLRDLIRNMIEYNTLTRYSID